MGILYTFLLSSGSTERQTFAWPNAELPIFGEAARALQDAHLLFLQEVSVQTYCFFVWIVFSPWVRIQVSKGRRFPVSSAGSLHLDNAEYLGFANTGVELLDRFVQFSPTAWAERPEVRLVAVFATKPQPNPASAWIVVASWTTKQPATL